MNDTPTSGGPRNADASEPLGDDTDGGLPVTRRQALAAVGGAGAAGLLGFALLDSDDNGGDRQRRAGGHLPYEVWAEIRTALATSPDHLPARAAALVEAGDLEAIFAFVRDDIATLPTRRDELGRFSINEGVRWGPRGTLRGGAGTPREKAQLLADLFTDAGAETTLVEGRTPLSLDQRKALFLREIDHAFDPDIDDDQLREWRQRMGVGDGPAVERLDPEGTQRTTLATRLLDAISEDTPYVDDFDWRMDSDLPVVRFREDGDEEDRYANLFGDAPFGESGATRIQDIVDASAPDVSVTLSAARTSDPSSPFDLVTGTWNAADIVGRQVVARTLPGIDPLQRPDVRFSDIGTFVPSLSVQGGDLDSADAASMSVLGDAVTRGGDRLSVAADGTVSRNGVPLAAVGDADAAERVRSVSVTPDVSRYPEVRLAVEARDGDGALVEGIPAGEIGLREEGVPAGATLQSTRASPRVTVLYDTSGSMPVAYSGEAMQSFVSSLTDEISAVDPDARVDLTRTNSNIWTAAAEAAATDANVVVYATDGDVADDLTPEIEQVLRAGPPVVMLSVDDGDDVADPVALQIAELSEGTAVPARDSTAARRAVRDFVADIADTLDPYQVVYTSPADGDAGDTHTVDVTIGSASGAATYTVPATTLAPPRLSSLWLTVTVGGRETTRLLAGYDPAVDDRPTEAMVAAVQGALFGSTTLTFEGTSPPLSVWLDDFLAAKGSTAALDTALTAGDQDDIDAATAAGLSSVPAEAFLLSAPLPGAFTEESITFPDAVRVAAVTHHPVFGSDQSRISGDILPLTRYASVTASEDPMDRFRTTVDRTAHLAVAETAGFEESTQSLLGETPVIPFGAADEDAWGRDRHDRFDDFVDTTGHRGASGMGYRHAALVPEDGSTFAYWAVDRETGGVLGVLPNGTNGGSSRQRHEQILNELSRVVSAINLLAMATGGGGLALGIVAQYGQVLARLYAAVAMAIEMMDASALPDAVAAAKADLVCRIARRTFLEVVPMGRAFRSISNLLNVVTGSTPASC